MLINATGINGNRTAFTNTPDGDVVSENIPVGQPGCMGAGGAVCTYYYLHDGLGSTMALVDSTGTVQNRYAYDPWGKMIASGTTGSVPNPFRYAGAMLDSATGLYMMGERYYDPSVGRFTQQDPAGAGYSYVDGNPVNFVDLGGLGKHHKKAKKHKTSKESTPHKAVRLVIDVLAVLPYGPYYLSENALVTLNKAGSHYGKPGQVVAYIVGAPFVPPPNSWAWLGHWYRLDQGARTR